MLKSTPAWLSWAMMALLLGLGLMFRFQGEISAPLEEDELLNVRRYATVDYQSDAETMRNVRPFDFVRTAKGLVKCFYTPWTPNNHLLNSLLMSVSTFFFSLSETSLRLPAALASIALVILVFWQVERSTNSKLLALLCGLLLLFHPYFMYYGQAARGYALTGLLVLLQVVLMEAALRRKPTLFTIIGLGLFTTAVFLNMVSVLIMWLAPLYLAVAVHILKRGAQKPWFLRWKDNEEFRWWMAHSIVAFGGIGLFILANLRHFLSAQQKFGHHFRTPSEMFKMLALDLGPLFPLPWLLFLILGLIGWGVMIRPRSCNWLGLAIVISLLTTLAYVSATRTIPYARVWGFYLVLLVFGIAALWNISAGRFRAAVRGMIVTALALVLVAEVIRPHPIHGAGTTYNALGQKLNAHFREKKPDEHSMLIVLPWVYAEEIVFYLPAGKQSLSIDSKTRSPLDVYFVARTMNGQSRYRVQYARREEQEMVYWDVPFHLPVVSQSDGGIIEKTKANVLRDFNDLKPGDVPLMVIWNCENSYFKFGEYVAEKIRTAQFPWTLPVNTVEFADPKALHVFLRQESDIELAKAIVADLSAQSAGETYILTRF